MKKKRAFTLVELLVVIGIIALLISILLPSLNRAREAANQIKCMSNLRTIGQALTMYINDNRGSFPWGLASDNFAWGDGTHGMYMGTNGPNGYTGAAYNWRVYLAEELNKHATSNTNASTQDRGPYGVFICPSSPTTVVNYQYTSYAVHPRLMPDMQMPDAYSAAHLASKHASAAHMVPYRISHVRRPSEILVAYDAAISNVDGPGTQTSSVTGFSLDNGAVVGANSDFNGQTTYMTDNYAGTSPPRSAGEPINTAAGDETPPFTANDYNKDDASNWSNIRFRHASSKQANVLFLDDHVQAFNYNPITHTTDLLESNINVPAPTSW